jgi:hypothetical protein
MESMPTGWVRFGALTFRQRLSVSGSALIPILFVPLMLGGPLALRPAMQSGGLWGIAAAVVGLIVVSVLILWVHAVLHPVPWVNLSTNELRSGKKSVPLASIDSAVLAVSTAKGPATLVLQIREGKKTWASVYLRKRHTALLSDRDRELFAEVLRRTTIAMPYSADDPKGRFAKYNFPGHVDKDTAIDLVLHTPKVGDPLPVSF